MYPYEICSIWFHKKDWEECREEEFLADIFFVS